MTEKIKLDIGSGRAKLAGYITIDKDPKVGADICMDIESVQNLTDDEIYFVANKKTDEQCDCVDTRLKRNHADEIRAHHILEHFHPENKVKVMRLFHDLLKTGGILDIEVPLFPHPASVQDPTHISFWCRESFKYFIKDDPFGEAFAKRHSEPTPPLFEFVEDWERGSNVSNPWAYGIKLKKI